MATVVLLGALDTKGDEYAFIRDRVIDAGCDVVMINAGVLGDPGYPIEFTRADVAAEAGTDIDDPRCLRGPRHGRDRDGRRCCFDRPASLLAKDGSTASSAWADREAHRS